MLRLYNTMAKDKQDFVPLEEGRVTLYSCGPTVYNLMHVGNARQVYVFDTLRRYLEYRGYKVTFVQNYTDIDDKIINRANEEGTSWDEISKRYMAEYETDAKGLGIRPADVHPKATEAMAEIIRIVKTLEDKGFAYAKDGDVYFRARKFGGYGKLSRQPIDELEAGSRVDISGAKEDPLDFALWKSAKPGEPSWASPWGKGRPGWHIECSAMVQKHLGQTIDIHGGGQDLVFPHHENEIAQSECATGKEYARFWMHNGFINVDSRKMSKSLGNFFTLREAAKAFGYETVKFFLAQAHYRSPLNYAPETLVQCKSALDRLHTCRDNLDFALDNAGGSDAPPAFLEGLAARKAQFIKAMDDDLNTADGLAALFELAKDCNIYFDPAVKRPRACAEAAIALYDELCGVLGLLYTRVKTDTDAEIKALIEERQQARKEKNFRRADEIRDTLKAQGVILEDTPQGVKYHIGKKA